MTTLSKVNTRRGGNNPPHAGFASGISPEAESSQTGVSVRFAFDENKHWFVLRATYGRAAKAYDFIIKDNTEAYMPFRHIRKPVDGKKRITLTPLLPSFLFVYSTFENVRRYVEETPKLHYLTYYYDHFKTDESGNNPPLIIPYDDMMNFIRLTSIDNEHIMLVDEKQCRYKGGDIVKIVDGDFCGVIGRVVRVAGQQRVAVTVNGLCTVVTAYIPTAFIRKVADCEK